MEKGRIAVPSVAPGGLDGERSEHFGHCEVFTLVDVEDGRITGVTTIPNQPHGHGGCMMTVNVLAQNGVNAVVVGGIGKGPLMGLNQKSIKIYFDGVEPKVRGVVEKLMSGQLPLISEDQVCSGHDHHH